MDHDVVNTFYNAQSNFPFVEFGSIAIQTSHSHTLIQRKHKLIQPIS